MNEITLGREVAAPPGDVWDVMTDLGSAPQTISGMKRLERLDGGDGFGVGTRWRETRVIAGREATEEMEVTRVDPGRSYTAESDSAGAHYRWTVSVDAREGDRSRLSMTFRGDPRGRGAKLLAASVGRLFAGLTRRALRADLDDIAAAAERRSSAPQPPS